MLDNMADRGLTVGSWDWRLTVVGAVLSVFVVTRVITTLRSTIALRTTGTRKTPPIVPYSIPGVGNMLGFVFDTVNFLGWMKKRYGNNTPVRFRVMNLKVHYISGAENILTLFRNSRDLTTTPSTIRILESAFGSPPDVSHILLQDKTGVFPQPLKDAPYIEPHNRIFSIIHKGLHTHLNGRGLATLGEKFGPYLEEELENLPIGKEDWTEVPDLYRMITMTVFTASTKALCGPHIFSLNPDFASDFWEFDYHVPTLFKSIPRWIAPTAYRLRDKLKASVQKWHAFADEHFDTNLEAVQPQDWEEYYGHRLMRERRIDHGNIDGFTKQAAASNDLGMIWGANANSIPLAGWMILESLLRPDVLSRAKDEIAQALDTSKAGVKGLDIAKLLSQPFLQSVYAEELRLRAGVAIQRVPVIDNFKIGPWEFPRDQMILASSWHEHRDKKVWNEGPVDGVMHPVDEFWAERFLVYPENPRSGPRKPDAKSKVKVRFSSEKDKEEEKNNMKIEGGNVPVFTIDPMQGSFVPYGGGMKMCPGRFYAKQEIMVATAMFLTMFDIELESKELPQPNMAYYPFGVVPPLGKFPARMKRR